MFTVDVKQQFNNNIEKVYSSLTEIILAQNFMEENIACTFLTSTVCFNSGKLSVRDSSHCNLPQSISESLQVSSSPDKEG